jgi:hypothetical protein
LSFWDAWYEDAKPPPGWGQLTAKERCVMVHADEGAFLNQVIAYFLGHEEVGMWAYSNDAEAISALVAEFAEIVSAMMARGVVEVRESPSRTSQWGDALPLDSARVGSVLADPATWIERRGLGNRYVMMTASYGGPKADLVGVAQPGNDESSDGGSGDSE